RFNFRGTSLTGFPAQSVGSSNVIALDSPYLLVLITGASQSRQQGRSELLPFQYQRSQNEIADSNVLISMRNETDIF
ncbi:hypothetical protein Tco_1382549, partial [Tanacetum coccineum]